MIKLLQGALIFLLSAALGLVVADLVLPGFHIAWNDWWGFLVAIVLFAILQSLFNPLATRLARRHAPALLGGIGLISTLIVLVVVVLIPGAGLGISEPAAWFLAPLIVWLTTALSTWLLGSVIGGRRRERPSRAG